MDNIAGLTPELKAQIAKANAHPKDFAETFLIEPNSEAKFKANFIQNKILDSKKKSTWFCIAGDTKIINTTTLRPERIDLQVNIKETLTFDFTENKVVKAKCKFLERGPKTCIKLFFGSGFTQTLTPDHELFTRDGWVKAGELKVGSRILAPSSIDVQGTLDLDDDGINSLVETTVKLNDIPDQVFVLSKGSLERYIFFLWPKIGRIFHGISKIAFMVWNRDFAEDLSHLLLRLRIVSRIDSDNNLYLDDFIDTEQFLYIVGLNDLIKDVRSARRWDIIVDIKPVRELLTYDLAVYHPDHNFIGNNIVLHNCIHRRAGKEQPLYSTIYTPTGPIRMGETKIGTVVCTPDGQTSKITGIYPQGKKQIYKLTLDDGTSVEAGEEHLWEVYTKISWRGPKGKSRQQYGQKILTTKEIQNNLIYTYSNRKEFNYKINGIKPVFFNKTNLPIEPYLLGVLLGDGCLLNSTVTTNDPEIIQRCEINSNIKFTKRKKYRTNDADNYFIPAAYIQNQLRSLGLLGKKSEAKFIPTKYLYSAFEDRLELLRGLMDTDGSSYKKRKGQAEFCTVSPQLATQVADLARSLGCKVTVKSSPGGYSLKGVKKSTKIRYRLYIRIPEDLEIFTLERKKCGGLPARYLRRTIVKIEELDFTEMQCIEIDHPDHLYITDNFIPTHNTYIMVVLAIWHAICFKRKKIILFAPSSDQINEFFAELDKFIEVNPFLSAQLKTHFKSPHQERSFQNGSRISGYILGLNSNLQDSRRGLGGDVILVDEAQALRSEDWKVISPIMLGTNYNKDTIRCYICGTVDDPASEFHQRVFNRGSTRDSEVICINILQNPDFTDERIQHIQEEVSAATWLTEYLLEASGTDSCVFKKPEVDAACSEDWEYSAAWIKEELPRFMSIDWDKQQCGTNILVTQYSPATRNLQAIYHEEIPQSEFQYMTAVNRVIELYSIFQPDLTIADKGSGEMQWEYLMLKSQELGLGLAEKLIKVGFGESLEIINPETNEPEKKPLKAFLVGLLQKKFQEKLIDFPAHHEEMKIQLYDYKVVRVTPKTTVYSSKREHLVDTWLFAMYGVFQLYENILEDTSAGIIRNVKANDLMLENRHEVEEQFWDSLNHFERVNLSGQLIPRSTFDDWNKPMERF